MHPQVALLVVYMLHRVWYFTRCFVVETPGDPLREGVGGCGGVRADATGYPGGVAMSKTCQHRHGKATGTRSIPENLWFDFVFYGSPSPALTVVPTHLDYLYSPTTANRQ